MGPLTITVTVGDDEALLLHVPSEAVEDGLELVDVKEVDGLVSLICRIS